jgi:hypothetical protein
VTDAYDALRSDWCEQGDLPRATCWHCGAHPGGPALPPLDRPWTYDGKPVVRRSGRGVFPSLATPPADTGEPLKLGRPTAGYCACGQPTRDNAYGCDDCARELERLFAEAPWIAEQLDDTITKQRGNAASNGVGSGVPLTCGHMDTDACGCPVSLPWNDKAAQILADLRKHLAHTVKVCQDRHIRHQSPYALDPNTDSTPSMAAWLLWRVDGLTFSDVFTQTLKAGLKVEKDALLAIDRGPDLLYLGLCDARDEDGLCGGAIYARAGEDTGKCRACRAEYDVNARRGGLERALDDRLCTASEIAHLATYLGLPSSVTRERVRNLVNQWHRRKIITGHVTREHPEPRFRYGDVAPRLAATYDTKGA